MIDYIGKRFGRLVVLEEMERVIYKSVPRGIRRVKCVCDCGNIGIHFANNLGKRIFSCGCYHRQIKTTHGFVGNPLYQVRKDMQRRCFDKKSIGYKTYGARGITVCKEWLDINNFINDMFATYKKGLFIDRIDNNGNYCKENCRRATRTEQQRNTTLNVKYNGLCIIEWAERLGINKSAFRSLSQKKGLEGAIMFYVKKYNLKEVLISSI